jgi:hypothetical protein
MQGKNNWESQLLASTYRHWLENEQKDDMAFVDVQIQGFHYNAQINDFDKS